MTEKLIAAVSEKIYDLFDGKYRVYTEKVRQNLEKPCFFTEIEEVEKVNLLGGRFFLRAKVKLLFEDCSETANYTAESMTGELFNALNFVKTDSVTLFGRKIKCKKSDSGFEMSVYYDLGIEEVKEDETAFMGQISVKENVCGIYEGRN